jgi:hypothetical protein
MIIKVCKNNPEFELLSLKYEWPIPEPALKPLMTMDSSIESEELFGLAKELIGNPINT